MTLNSHTPRIPRFAFILFIVISLSFSATVFAKKRSGSSGRGRSARAEKKKSTARNRRTSRRGGRYTARSSRRGRTRLSAREVRRQRALVAREQSSALRALERRLRRPLTRRERAAELRRVSSRHRRAIQEARRRAEAARLAAIARQRAIDAAMRNEVQSFIAKDDLTGEDPEVRRIAVNALGNHAGTVVVMDPMSGRVYSVVNQEWALRRGFKPCSTIKLVTGVAGLAESVIAPTENASMGRGLDLTSALAHSDNPYFQRVGSQIGFDKMVNYARALGLGEKTGVNVPFEFSGRLPELKPGFSERRMFSHADGFQVTPLQLGTLVSAMANGGRLLVPQIQRSKNFDVKVRRQLEISSDVWQRMIPGMVGAVNYGSGRKAYDPLQTVAGKTGTCIGDGGWVGLFTSYAPLANPRLAVVVITQGTDARRHFPAAVAGEIYRGLNHRFGTAINMQVADTLDDEEKEVAEAEAAAEAAETSAAADMTESNQAPAITDNQKTATSVAPTKSPAAVKPTTSEAPSLRGTVKRVLMPIEKRNTEPAKTPGGQVPASNNTAAPPASGEQRPRRAQPEQP